MSGALGRPWGRTRRALAALLEKEGCRVEMLSAAQGRERSDVRFDIYRWSATIHHPEHGTQILDSWEPMTKCVKQGIEIDWKAMEVNVK